MGCATKNEVDEYINIVGRDESSILSDVRIEDDTRILSSLVCLDNVMTSSMYRTSACIDSGQAIGAVPRGKWCPHPIPPPF